ncbi:MAG: C45 family peptidase [Oligoflexia bacterium]|nr:C45 family peptidase [Oligoflexia bacterium]
MSGFPIYELEGTPAQIGESAGKLFGDRIQSTYAFYEDLYAELLRIGAEDSRERAALRSTIQEYADGFAETIRKWCPDYAVEIESSADAAKMPHWQVYALNSRTEIYRLIAVRMKSAVPGECTALYFPQHRILGQNWDWHPKLEELTVMLKVKQRSGQRMVMMTEPGIIGKIGVNSDGLGVCLNILFDQCKIEGLPIHILLRAVLDSSDTKTALSTLERLPRGTVSNVLIADRSGDAVDVELRGAELRRVALPGGELIHTNHYLADESTASSAIPGSVHRLKRAEILHRQFQGQGLDGMKRLLADHESKEFPICRGYSQGLDFMIGTVASIIIVTGRSELWIASGQNAVRNEWRVISAV